MGNVDREKVIKGLECCSGDYALCTTCYLENSGTCRDTLMKDALELLKAQEPRVMTVDEVEALKRGEVVWYEQHTPERDYIQPMVADGRGFIGNADLGVKLCYLGHCERLWTAEPTDEQREAVKWDD